MAWIRRTAFWMLDALRGRKIKTHYDDIAARFEDGGEDGERLRDILSYAMEHVPFYKGIERPELSRFPVMSKPLYKQNGEACFSDEFPDREALYKASTSGSTGTPLVVYQNADKRRRLRADLIYAHERVGWRLGDHYFFIRNWVSNYNQSPLKNFAQAVTNVSIAEFDDAKKAWLCGQIKKRKNCVIFGYASSVCDFMRYVKARGVDTSAFKIKLIVCDSDELTVANKRELERTFSCPVINRYDNEENGLLAFSLPYSEEMLVNHPSIHVELLKPDCDEPVAPGEIGRVVVTDLYNRAMPLIRADIGDYAGSPDESGRIRVLSEFAGRKADCIYSPHGVLVSSVAISGITEVFDTMEKYQIIQESRDEYTFKYVGTLSDEARERLDGRLTDSLSRDAKITYLNVEDIPVGANGKFKPLVNRYQA